MVRRTAACLMALNVFSEVFSSVFAKVHLKVIPTEVVEVLAVGARKKVKVVVKNLYPHDIQIITIIGGIIGQDDLVDNHGMSSPSPSGDNVTLFNLPEPLPAREMAHGASQDFSSADSTAMDLEAEGKEGEQQGEDRAAQREPQRGIGIPSATSPLESETGGCLSCAAQGERLPISADGRTGTDFFSCSWLPQNVPLSNGQSVCRLILRMKTGERAEELKRLQKFLRVQHTRETTSGTQESHAPAFKGGRTPETTSLIAERIGKLFALDDKQARLVTALHFLDKLDMTIVQLEPSKASEDTLAAVALRNALAESADVDFVEVDQVVYALHENGVYHSSQKSTWGHAVHQQRADSALKRKTHTTPVAEDVAGTESLLDMIAQNLHIARKVVERVMHTDAENADVTNRPRPIVAVIDTGVNYLHPALASQMWVNEDEKDGIDGIDDDGNGYVDDIYGYNFFSNSGDPMDVDGHGTHCAGIIAAKRSKTPYRSEVKTQVLFGVNPSARIMALKFIERQTGFVSDAARSLEYALQHGALISSNSWGNASSLSRTLLATVKRAAGNNMLLVTASGNARHGKKPDDLDKTPLFPAALPNDNVLTVAAMDSQGHLASFSNYGRTSVPLAAPGFNIVSTWLHDTYKREAGTSQACPFVAGVASLLYSIKPHSAYGEIKHVLVSTAKRLPSLNGKIAYGLVDARAAALTMEQLIQAWAVVLEAPSDIPRNGKGVITIQLLGKTLGHHETTMKILLVYEGLPLGAVEIPVSVHVSEPFNDPLHLELGPVVGGLFSLPTSLIMKAAPNDELTLRVEHLKNLDDDTTFFGIPPPASVFKKESTKSISLLHARCRRATPGQGKIFLILSIRGTTSFHRWQMQQQSSHTSSPKSSGTRRRVHAYLAVGTESSKDRPSFPHIAQQLSPSNWLPFTMEDFARPVDAPDKLKAHTETVPREQSSAPQSTEQSTTTGPTIQHISTMRWMLRSLPTPAQQPVKQPSISSNSELKARTELVRELPVSVSTEQPRETTPVLQPNFRMSTAPVPPQQVTAQQPSVTSPVDHNSPTLSVTHSPVSVRAEQPRKTTPGLEPNLRMSTAPVPAQQVTRQQPSVTSPVDRNSGTSSVRQPPLGVSTERLRKTTTPALQTDFRTPARQDTNLPVHTGVDYAHARNLSNTTDAGSPEKAGRHPVVQIHTVTFSCDAIDIKVEPHELSAVLAPGGLEVFVIQITKGNSLLYADTQFALEVFSISAVPCAGMTGEHANQSSVHQPLSVGLGFPVDFTSLAAPARASEEECFPLLGNSGKYTTYYYFTPGKVPPKTLPLVQFFWADLRAAGQKIRYLPAHDACAYQQVKLGFRFPFWEEAYENVLVSPYGVALAPLYAPYFYETESMVVYFKTWNDRAIFQWEGKTSTASHGDPDISRLSFQLVLHISGRILFYYNKVPPSSNLMQHMVLLVHIAQAGIVSPDGLSSLLCTSAVVRDKYAVLLYPANLFLMKLNTRHKISAPRQQQHKANHPRRRRLLVEHSDDAFPPPVSLPPFDGVREYDSAWTSGRSLIDGADGESFTFENVPGCNYEFSYPGTSKLRQQDRSAEESASAPGMPKLPCGGRSSRPSRPTSDHDFAWSNTNKADTTLPRLFSASLLGANRYKSAWRPSIQFASASHAPNSRTSTSTHLKFSSAGNSTMPPQTHYGGIFLFSHHEGIIPAGVLKTSVEILAVPGLRESGTRFTGSVLFKAVSFDNRLHAAVHGSGLIDFNVTVLSTGLQHHGPHCA